MIILLFSKILIVAECNVNRNLKARKVRKLKILIVAECNVNEGEFYGVVVAFYILIVAECNVNCADEETSDALETF